MSQTFYENVVIITGASSGIGAELARQLAAQGAWLALAARHADPLDAVAEQVRARGGRALIVPPDVSAREQCEALIARTVSEYGRIDTLVCNAAAGMWATLEEVQDPALYEQIARVNYLGTVYPVYYGLSHLRQTRGRIVGVSSLAGRTGVPARTGYSAAKHAQIGFLESLRVELLGSGVSVTILLPDFVASGFHERIVGGDGQPLGKGHPVDYRRAMSTEQCARISVKAIAARKRQVIMSARGRLGQWLKLVAPGLIDRVARRAIQTGR